VTGGPRHWKVVCGTSDHMDEKGRRVFCDFSGVRKEKAGEKPCPRCGAQLLVLPHTPRPRPRHIRSVLRP
jgi:DNA-directed RNA polymerase subunit RPC12/RpoP